MSTNSDGSHKPPREFLHIKVKVGGRTEIMPVANSRFELYVSKVFYDEMNKQVLKAESLSEVVRILTARTVFDGS
jgi:hypothetical protein